MDNIRDKYAALEENLDEFLFEFVRPYAERQLAPLYERFTESQEFSELKREAQTEEIFSWVLSARPVAS